MTIEAQGSAKSRPRFTMRQIFMNQTFSQQQNNEVKDSSVFTTYRKLRAIRRKEFKQSE